MSSLYPRRSATPQDPPDGSYLVGIDDEDAEAVFSALSSETTREILASLYDAPRAASDVADETGTTLQNAKYHLDKLREADLVEVADTWYSESGCEMKVYAPRNESLVLFATEDDEPLRKALARLLGAVAVLGVASKAIDHVLGLLREPRVQDTALSVEVYLSSDGTSSVGATTGSAVHLSVGEAFFVAGLVAILSVAVWKYRSRLPSSWRSR